MYSFFRIDILRHICTMYFSSSILNDLLEYARQQDADTDQIARKLGAFHKDQYISYERTIKAIDYFVELLNDEHLGLHIGEQISLKVTAYVNSIMQYSDTLEEAFENAVKYAKLISDALESSLHKTERYYSVAFVENPNWKVYPDHAKKQILDLTLLSCLKSLVAYTNRVYYPVKICFEGPKPKILKEYYRLFNCSLYFNQQKTEIFFEKQVFKHAKAIKKGLLENLKEKVADEMSQLKPENELVYNLKKCILKHKPERILIEQAAIDLEMSARTLQRRLKTLNTSFKAIEYELQLRLAKSYLEENHRSIDEISYLLGFSESSAFIRFFKSLTGITPLYYIRSGSTSG